MEKHIIVDEDVHRIAKVKAAKEGKTLKSWIRERVVEEE